MKRLVFLMAALLICSGTLLADEGRPAERQRDRDRPMSPERDRDRPVSPEQVQQQTQRLRNAQRELNEQRRELQEQRRDLDAGWRELEEERGMFEREQQGMRPQPGMERPQCEACRDRMEHAKPWGQHKPMYARIHQYICKVVILTMCLVIHILVAIWIFQDIRTRGTGSGIWIVIGLIAGLLGALVYAVVRIGDVKKQ